MAKMRNKKARPAVDNPAEDKRSHKAMLGKVVSGVIGSTIAAQAGKSGALGAAAGVVINRVVSRSPMGALVIGGIWVGSKLYKRRKEREEQKFEAAAQAAKRVQAADPATSPPPGKRAK